MSQKNLREQAHEAKRMLSDNHELKFVHRKLSRGLEWVVERRGNQTWRLAMAREDTFPGGIEVTILRNAFDVPISVDESRATKTRTHPKTGREITYYVVEVEWTDRTLPREVQMEMLPS